ncbi:hypothetical protein RHMOL_Rhmol06G0225200 [Rhododendron molle]|uniref:Uncharacterized protein n=1 Tax=Rhododendron molle TaxID=49168 RepID=A0ACC0NFY7_RHOML|nr:hypothetical protein RHMOL_Rhmol06G0225200 [Rhododendron molle]
MVGWQIWKTRNDFVFNHNPIDLEKTMRNALEALCEFSELRIPLMVPMDNPTVEVNSTHWRAPDHGSFKMNCDVAVRRNGRDAMCSAILRDDKGKMVDG